MIGVDSLNLLCGWDPHAFLFCLAFFELSQWHGYEVQPVVLHCSHKDAVLTRPRDTPSRACDHPKPSARTISPMAHHMVSAGNEPWLSVALSNASSVLISTDSQSIISGHHIMTTPDSPAAQSVELGAKSTTLPGDGAFSSSIHTRHDSYFFQDGNITFLVGDALQ